MRVIAGSGAGGAAAWLTALVGSVAILGAATVSGRGQTIAAGLAVCLGAVALKRATFISWQNLLAGLILLILFVPIRRYTVPIHLPFQLEPYRMFVFLLILAWIASLLVDPRVKLRGTAFDGPIALIVATSLASIVANPGRASAVSSDVAKRLMFFLSFVVVLYLVAAAVRRMDSVEFLVKTLVAGGSVVAVSAVIEARTQFNVFDHLSRAIPLLRSTGAQDVLARGAGVRVFASAQHPIALGAVFVMLTPLAIYLGSKYRQRRWWACTAACTAATAATLSRTGVMMFLVVILVALWLRPRQTRRMWPAVLPVLVVVHFAVPGAIGSLSQSFSGVVTQQQSGAGSSGSGRLADVGPSMQRFKQRPLFGMGYGTRIVDPEPGLKVPLENILDDQWLTSLLETGVLGVGAWVLLFVRVIRRLGRAAKRDDSDRGSLLVALTAGVAAFAIGMLTYDAFAFVQVSFILFIFIGLGSSVLKTQPQEVKAPLAIRLGRRRRSDRTSVAAETPAG